MEDQEFIRVRATNRITVGLIDGKMYRFEKGQEGVLPLNNELARSHMEHGPFEILGDEKKVTLPVEPTLQEKLSSCKNKKEVIALAKEEKGLVLDEGLTRAEMEAQVLEASE